MSSTRKFREALAALPGEPIGEPPARLSADVRRAWLEIEAAAPAGVLQRTDRIFLELCARRLAQWRAGELPAHQWTRESYRWLGKLFIPIAERRALLFPERRPRASSFQ